MKKRIGTIILSVFFFAVIFAIAPNIEADAAGVTQTAVTKNSATVKWTAPTDKVAECYRVYVESSNYEYVLYKTLDASQTSIQINNLPAGCERHIKVEYDYRSSYNPSNKYSMTLGYADIRTLPGKVTGLKQERWYYFALSFDAVWNRQERVDGYQYIVKTNKNKVKASGTVSGYSNYFTVRKISNEVIYTARVRAFSTINGVKYYGDWSDTVYFFTQPRVTKAKVSGSKLTVKWKKVGGATGYDVYVSTKKTSGYKKVKSVSSKTSSVTIKKLGKKKFSKKKTYYVYVVTKKKVNGRTSTSGRLYYWNTKNSIDGFF